jgi:hypothetical protein
MVAEMIAPSRFSARAKRRSKLRHAGVGVPS